MYTLNVPPYSKYWPDDGLVKPKYVDKTMFNFCVSMHHYI